MHRVRVWLLMALWLHPVTHVAWSADKPLTLAGPPAHVRVLPGRKKRPVGAVIPKLHKKGRGAAAALPLPPPLPPMPPLPTQFHAVALYPVQALDIDADDVALIVQDFLNEIDEIANYRSVSPEDLMSDVSRVNLNPEACERDIACLAQNARYGRAHAALEVRLSSLSGVENITVRLIDAEKAVEVDRLAEPLAVDPQGRLQQIHRIAVQLLTPAAFVGNLAIQCSQVGADIYLDDKLLGQTPLPKLEPLKAGLHVLHATKPGFNDINRFVDVVYNRSSTLQIDLSSDTITGVIEETRSATGFGALYLYGGEPGIEIRIDGEPVGTTILSEPITRIAAGKHRITLRKGGKPAVVQTIDIPSTKRVDVALKITDDAITVAAVTPTEINAPLPDKPRVASKALTTPAGPPIRTQVWNFPTWRYYAGIGGAAAGGASVIVSFLCANAVREFQAEADAIAKHSKPVAEGGAGWTAAERAANAVRLANINARAPKYELAQWLTLGTGIVVGAAGAGLIVWDLLDAKKAAAAEDHPGPGTSMTLMPWTAPHSAGISIAGQW